MDTNVQNVDQNVLVDMFPELGGTSSLNQIKPEFGMQVHEADILTHKSTTEETTQATVNQDGEGGEEGDKKEGKVDDKKEVDILGNDKPTPTAEIKDLTSYFQDRVRSGKFIAIEEEDAEGNKTPFIPKTPEEYDEVLELQINYRVEQAKKDLEKSWYDSKSPAWKVVSQYAELVDNPAELIPFIQGVQTIQSVANIDENEIDGAEQIVRARLLQRGDPEEIVNQQIEALKTTDKLVSTAKQYKPIILQQEQQVLARQMKEKEEEERKYSQLISELRDAAIQELEKPIFGKAKLKQEEKALIYDLIGEPSQETQGYGIYNAIDNLFEKRDFNTLKQVALLLAKNDSFYNYLGANVANQTAASLEKKLRLAGESKTSSGKDYDEENRPIQRNQYKTKPTFGRQ